MASLVRIASVKPELAPFNQVGLAWRKDIENQYRYVLLPRPARSITHQRKSLDQTARTPRYAPHKIHWSETLNLYIKSVSFHPFRSPYCRTWRRREDTSPTSATGNAPFDGLLTSTSPGMAGSGYDATPSEDRPASLQPPGRRSLANQSQSRERQSHQPMTRQNPPRSRQHFNLTWGSADPGRENRADRR